MPSHEEIRTEYLPTIYAESEEKQVQAIADEILKNTAKTNFLETCADDIAVKDLAGKVRAELERRSKPQPKSGSMESKGAESKVGVDFDQFYADTNDSGKKESDMLLPAGEIGANVFSSRMGRGTDVKPKSKERGMYVLRTYAAIPAVRKQENGRQGRNGMPGCARDIINYSAVLKDYQAYSDPKSPYAEQLQALMRHETTHLDKKLKKHKQKLAKDPKYGGILKWEPLLNNPDTKKKYLTTRAVTQLKYEIKQKQEEYLRRKELLVATVNGNVLIAMQGQINQLGMGQEVMADFKTAWQECLAEIDAAWNCVSPVNLTRASASIWLFPRKPRLPGKWWWMLFPSSAWIASS